MMGGARWIRKWAEISVEAIWKYEDFLKVKTGHPVEKVENQF